MNDINYKTASFGTLLSWTIKGLYGAVESTATAIGFLFALLPQRGEDAKYEEECLRSDLTNHLVGLFRQLMYQLGPKTDPNTRVATSGGEYALVPLAFVRAAGALATANSDVPEEIKAAVGDMAVSLLSEKSDIYWELPPAATDGYKTVDEYRRQD